MMETIVRQSTIKDNNKHIIFLMRFQELFCHSIEILSHNLINRPKGSDYEKGSDN